MGPEEIPRDIPKLSATVRMGVSKANKLDAPDSVSKQADSALYDAKRA